MWDKYNDGIGFGLSILSGLAMYNLWQTNEAMVMAFIGGYVYSIFWFTSKK